VNWFVPAYPCLCRSQAAAELQAALAELQEARDAAEAALQAQLAAATEEKQVRAGRRQSVQGRRLGFAALLCSAGCHLHLKVLRCLLISSWVMLNLCDSHCNRTR
jgi:hypothetical protein